MRLMPFVGKTMFAGKTIAFVFALSLASGCTSNGPSADGGPGTAAPTTVEGSATAATRSAPPVTSTTRAPFILQTPTPSPTPLPAPTSQRTPGPERTPEPRDVGVMLLDASGAGDHQLIYESRTHYGGGGIHSTTFAADGSLWMNTWDTTGARRFASDGTLLEQIDGASNVVRSADGAKRAYYVHGDEVGSGHLVIEQGEERTLVPGPASFHRFSPDGTRIAYYVPGDDNASTLRVLDLDTGESRDLAFDIDPCPCHSSQPPAWSPSGDYLSYRDYGFLGPDPDDPGGDYVVAAAAGAPMAAAARGWIKGAAGDLLVSSNGDEWPRRRATLFDPSTGEHLPLPVDLLPDEYAAAAETVAGSSLIEVYVPESESRPASTLLVDPLSGQTIERWDVVGQPVLTPTGPAVAVHTANSGRNVNHGCSGIYIVHAAVSEPTCIEGGHRGEWSPDGSLLAIWGSGRDNPTDWVGVWSPEVGLQVRFERDDLWMGSWSPDGSSVLVAWGVGL